MNVSSGIGVGAYESGAVKSADQRQNLTTTCLAAMLSYQLAGEDGVLAQLLDLVLDEALDLADLSPPSGRDWRQIRW